MLKKKPWTKSNHLKNKVKMSKKCKAKLYRILGECTVISKVKWKLL